MLKIGFAALAAVVCMPAAGQVVVNSAPSGTVYGSWANVYAPPGQSGQHFGVQFTLTGTTTLAGISVFTTANFAVPGQQTVVEIFNDDAGTVGTELYRDGFSISDVTATPYNFTVFGSSYNVVAARTNFDPITLAAGTYWIADAGFGSELGWVSFNDGGPSLRFDQINLAEYPSPATYFYRLPFLLHADGVATGEFDPGGAVIPSGVPEPTSWALMIVGFGLVGAMLRRRSGRRAPAHGIC